MKLEKAIEVAEDIIHYVEPGDPPEEHDAIRLLIEAGVRFLDERPHCWGLRHPILPGED